ncbi:multidrug ABC transporter permease/ATP-binding protein, partial [Klebsiella pneumoniae]
VVAGERVIELKDRPRQAWGSDDAPQSSGLVENDQLTKANRGDRQEHQENTQEKPTRSNEAQDGQTGSGKRTHARLMKGKYPKT